MAEASSTTERPPVLAVEGLTVSFRAVAGVVPAVRGVDLTVGAGETVALVGESGSGKSASVLGMLGLFHPDSAAVEADRLEFEGITLSAGRREDLQDLLGTRIGIIFQDPQSSLDPTMRVGKQIAEVPRLRQRLDRDTVRRKVLDSLAEVGIRDPEWCASAYPHELSGGMRQRAMIATVMIAGPSLLIADEPTTALDVTLQAQVIDLLDTLQQERGTGILFITHDLSLVSEFADRVMVMYAGTVVRVRRHRGRRRTAVAPVHQGAAGVGPAPRRGPGHTDTGAPARSPGSAQRLPVPDPVRPCPRPLRAGRASRLQAAQRPDHPLLARRAGGRAVLRMGAGSGADRSFHAPAHRRGAARVERCGRLLLPGGAGSAPTRGPARSGGRVAVGEGARVGGAGGRVGQRQDQPGAQHHEAGSVDLGPDLGRGARHR